MNRLLPAILVAITMAGIAGCNVREGVPPSTDVSDAGMPDRVREAWEREFPGADVTAVHYVKNAEGDSVYNVIYYQDSRSRKLNVTPEGEVTRRIDERRIPVGELPPAAVKAMREEFPEKEIVDVYHLSVNGAEKYYANVLLDGEDDITEKAGFHFNPEGKVMKRTRVAHPRGASFDAAVLY